MQYCYGGNILTIDLSTNETKLERTKEEMIEKYMGGDGFGAKLLYDCIINKSINPLSEDNVLIITPTVLCGTTIPTSGKTGFFFLSPLTGGWGESFIGGPIGSELKQIGLDALIIKGKAEKPSYIFIENDKIKILPAQYLWGKNTRETADKIKEEIGQEVIVATIGIAGENLVKYALIDCEDRQAGRGGAGAVMGSKNLKAIVLLGTKDIRLAYPEKIVKIMEKYRDIIKKDASFERNIKFGSGEFFNWMNEERGAFPTKNWQYGVFEQRQKLDPHYWGEGKYTIKNKACFACTKPCGQMFVIKDGKYKGTEVDGPDYETFFALGGNCFEPDIEVVAKANELCDLYGIDTISTGGCIAFAMELYERGIISLEDTGGVELTFGNSEALLSVIEKIAKREDIGNILAEGVKKASKIIGKSSERYAVQVRGMEPPGYDVRGIKGMGLALMTSPRGACHLRSGVYALELTGQFWKFKDIDRLSTKNKGYEVAEMENFMTVYDILGICKFSRGFFLIEKLPEILKAAIGKSFDENLLLKVGERVNNIKHLINISCGWKKEDCKLPLRITEDPIPEGASAGHLIEEKDSWVMLSDYFKARGWDEDGFPTKDKLIELDLEEFYENYKTSHSKV